MWVLGNDYGEYLDENCGVVGLDKAARRSTRVEVEDLLRMFSYLAHFKKGFNPMKINEG